MATQSTIPDQLNNSPNTWKVINAKRKAKPTAEIASEMANKQNENFYYVWAGVKQPDKSQSQFARSCVAGRLVCFARPSTGSTVWQARAKLGKASTHTAEPSRPRKPLVYGTAAGSSRLLITAPLSLSFPSFCSSSTIAFSSSPPSLFCSRRRPSLSLWY